MVNRNKNALEIDLTASGPAGKHRVSLRLVRVLLGVFSVGMAGPSTDCLHAQTLFNQTFSSGTSITTYVNATNPSTGQFNIIAGSGGAAAVILDPDEGTGNVVGLDRTNGTGVAWFARTKDFSPIPVALKFEFALGVAVTGGPQDKVALLQLGSGFTTNGTPEPTNNVFAQLGFDFYSTNLSYYGITDGNGRYIAGYYGDASGGLIRCQWILNNSGTTLTYTNFTNTLSVLTNDCMDLWVQLGDLNVTTRVLNNFRVPGSGVGLTDFKCVFNQGAGAIGFDNLRITPLTVSNAAPVIIAQPTNLTVLTGSNALFTVNATGFPAPDYRWRFNGTNLPGETNASLLLPAVTTNQAGPYSVAISNSLGAVTSQVAQFTVLVPLTLSDALDRPGLLWTNLGAAAWTAQTNVTHDGVDAARSGVIGNNQASTLSTTVEGPGTLSFWWRVSSEPNYDFLSLQDSKLGALASLSGESGWLFRTVELDAGSHTLYWIYYKDVSASSGLDAGFVDQVTFTPAVAPPSLAVPEFTTGGTFRFHLQGQTGAVYQILAATNLTTNAFDWLPIATVTNQATPLHFTDPQTNLPQRFYRAIVVPQ